MRDRSLREIMRGEERGGIKAAGAAGGIQKHYSETHVYLIYGIYTVIDYAGYPGWLSEELTC